MSDWESAEASGQAWVMGLDQTEASESDLVLDDGLVLVLDNGLDLALVEGLVLVLGLELEDALLEWSLWS